MWDWFGKYANFSVTGSCVLLPTPQKKLLGGQAICAKVSVLTSRLPRDYVCNYESEILAEMDFSKINARNVEYLPKKTAGRT